MKLSRVLRQGYARLLENMASDAALSLTYNEWPISVDRIRRDLRGLHARVDRQLLGRRFHLRPPLQRSQVWAVIEKIDSYPHMHCGWGLPHASSMGDLFHLFEGGIWSTMAPRGGYDIHEYRHGWGTYATKNLSDTLYIIDSAEFLR
jgi:hypothetical protein